MVRRSLERIRKWVISNETDTWAESRGPRARSASGLITHASWRIINISSSPRRGLVGRAKWNERDIALVRRHGRTRLAFSSALYSALDPFAIVNRTRIGRVIDRWLAFPRNLAPTLAEACLVQCLGATTFEYRFPYAPLQSRENRSNLIVPPFYARSLTRVEDK